MPFVSVDHTRCARDKICIAECPFGLIVEGEGGFPEMRPAGARLCIRCGHCAAACPHQALTLAGLPCFPLPNGSPPSMRKLGELLKCRRSTRNYLPDRVPHETIERLLDLTRWAPSAKNEQPVHWLVIESGEEVRRLAGLVVEWLRENGAYPGMVAAWEEGIDQVLRSAPHLVLAHADAEGLKPEVDCTIALSYFEIAAASAELGTCWAGILMGAAAAEYPPLLAALDLPPGHRVYGAMMLGYPRNRYFGVPARKELRVRWQA